MVMMGSIHIYGTVDDAVRLVAVYAKHMALGPVANRHISL